MLSTLEIVIATFSSPEPIQTNPQSLLLLLPLVAAIAIIYKATKMPTITTGGFLKETLGLFGSIVVFIVINLLDADFQIPGNIDVTQLFC